MSEERWTGLEWQGSTVVVLASGESLSAEQCEMVRVWRAAGDRRRVIAINTTFRRAPWADVLYACDAPWWKNVNLKTGLTYHAEAKATFHGELWTQDENAVLLFEDLRRIKSEPKPGLGRVPGVIHQGQNGGYQAVNLAYQAGAELILLLGFDMKGGHWHGEHPKPLTNTKQHLFAAYLQHFERMARDFLSTDCRVVNCTPGSALQSFPTAALETMLAAEAVNA